MARTKKMSTMNNSIKIPNVDNLLLESRNNLCDQSEMPTQNALPEDEFQSDEDFMNSFFVKTTDQSKLSSMETKSAEVVVNNTPDIIIVENNVVDSTRSVRQHYDGHNSFSCTSSNCTDCLKISPIDWSIISTAYNAIEDVEMTNFTPKNPCDQSKLPTQNTLPEDEFQSDEDFMNSFFVKTTGKSKLSSIETKSAEAVVNIRSDVRVVEKYVVDFTRSVGQVYDGHDSYSCTDFNCVDCLDISSIECSIPSTAHNAIKDVEMTNFTSKNPGVAIQSRTTKRGRVITKRNSSSIESPCPPKKAKFISANDKPTTSAQTCGFSDDSELPRSPPNMNCHESILFDEIDDVTISLNLDSTRESATPPLVLHQAEIVPIEQPNHNEPGIINVRPSVSKNMPTSLSIQGNADIFDEVEISLNLDSTRDRATPPLVLHQAEIVPVEQPKIKTIVKGRPRGAKNKPKIVKKNEYGFDSEDESVKQTVSYDEKRDLALAVLKMEVSQVRQVIEILKHRGFQNTWIETQKHLIFDFSDLDNVTFYEIKSFKNYEEEKTEKKKRFVSNDPIVCQKKIEEITKEIAKIEEEQKRIEEMEISLGGLSSRKDWKTGRKKVLTKSRAKPKPNPKTQLQSKSIESSSTTQQQINDLPNHLNLSESSSSSSSSDSSDSEDL